MAQEAGGNGNKTVVILLGVVIVLLVAVIGVFGAMLIKSNKTNQELQQEATEKQEKRSVVVSEKNIEEVAEELAQATPVETGYYEASMNTTWTFPTGSDVSEDAYVANVEGNTNDVYFDVVMAADEDQVIYKSPVIPRGGELEGFALDTALEAGTYDCVCIYHLIDDEQNTISTLRVGVTVIVKQ